MNRHVCPSASGNGIFSQKLPRDDENHEEPPTPDVSKGRGKVKLSSPKDFELHIQKMKLSLCFLVLVAGVGVNGLQSPHPPVSQLVTKHAGTIASLKSLTTEVVGSIAEEPYSNDLFYLHFCLQAESDADGDAAESLKKSLAWRTNEGKQICDSARNALAKAQEGGGWDNKPVLDASPHVDRISKYITPATVLTTSNNDGDLVYCVRAGKIADNDLMAAVTVDEMKDFFLYAKEVNALVSYQRSAETDRLCQVLTANDLDGVKLVGGSKEFRTALGESSKAAAIVYPKTINGPTLLCNLPGILNALVKLFTPLFPDSVKARLKFAKLDALKDVESLTEFASTSTSSQRKVFLEALERVLAA